MIGRRPLVAVALLAGLAAGTLYYLGAQRSAVVVAARDIDGLRPLVAADVVVRSFPADSVPAGALADTNPAVGKRVRAPLLAGQLILSSGLADEAALFQSGLVPPSGTRAIAVPASPAQALGGAIAPGARVDLIAVPVNGRAPAGRATEMLASGALVLDVRTDAGGPLTRAASKPALAATSERLGSVVLAIPVREELIVADRIATSTFVLVLSGSR